MWLRIKMNAISVRFWLVLLRPLPAYVLYGQPLCVNCMRDVFSTKPIEKTYDAISDDFGYSF